MDFNLSPEQVDAAALAKQILDAEVTPERQREADQAFARHDVALFKALGDAGLVGLALPESHGGGGLGIAELSSVVTEVGRVVAPVALAAHGAASLTLAAHGTSSQQEQWLAGAADGTALITAALSEDRAELAVNPSVVARRDGESWVLTGTKTLVPAGTLADVILVPASTEDGVRLFLVQPGDADVEIEGQQVSDFDTTARIEFAGARLGADRVVGDDAQAVTYLAEASTALLCAQQLGVVEGALALTASYSKEREQFGRPIGSFQAVSQRLADGYIDVLGLRLTTWQAVWQLNDGRPAAEAVAIAKLWAADTGHKIAHTTVHVHGGVGIDVDGPAHRFFVAAKRLEFALGGATAQAKALGAVLATEPV